MTLEGICVVCGKFLREADYRAQSVVALIGPEGTVVCCVSHVMTGRGPEYQKAVRLMAEAKAA